MTEVYRFFVEKKPIANEHAQRTANELMLVFGLSSVSVRIFNRYDIEGVAKEDITAVTSAVLTDPVVDICYPERLPQLEGARVLCIEALPGQFDIRADSCEQCAQMLLGGTRPAVRFAAVYALYGIESDSVYEKIKRYLINPVESKEASLDKPLTLKPNIPPPPADIPIIEGFADYNESKLNELITELGLAMSLDDIKEAQNYFNSEKRVPTLTELRLLDTYWSDHCRHTTFNTIIEQAVIEDTRVKRAFELFKTENGDKPVTLMNIALAGMRCLKAKGKLPHLNESDENNACCVDIKISTPSGIEDALLFFKNETHNHPTEIEPFGGAATCIGGAIRDPLSGRAYVYHAMRITGSGDPSIPLSKTPEGKLPQRKLTTTAAAGFSSYGNQIGLATGFVRELYHNGYIAKRLETGAVIGAAKKEHVRREKPAPGDIVLIIGGATGKDGIGGATGSSKTQSQNAASLNASEVQKGNAPEERKLQRLFRNPDFAKLIKKCNDFGAGGAAVAIGELADGIKIDLSSFPVKYEGLDGTELAISESQERMAVVVSPADAKTCIKLAEEENTLAVTAAVITKEPRLVFTWRGKTIADIARSFLETNGAKRYSNAYIPALPPKKEFPFTSGNIKLMFKQLASDLNFCSQKGLVERFDSTIGAGSILVPYGGKTGLGEAQVMAALLPPAIFNTTTASVMAYGYEPKYTEQDPFEGSVYAVVSSVAKLIAAGVKLDTVHLSLQEYFPRVNNDPKRMGVPLAAMLGAFSAELGLGTAAIGGKDSMSGTCEDMDVAPTLISFAVGTAHARDIISQDFKEPSRNVYLAQTPLDDTGLPNYEALLALWEKYNKLCENGDISSARVCEQGGAYGAVLKMSLGNMVGFKGELDRALFERLFCSVVFETQKTITDKGFLLIGQTTAAPEIALSGEAVSLAELAEAYEAPLESIFPVYAKHTGSIPQIPLYTKRITAPYAAKQSFAKPRAVIPVFPGTNCEYDTAAAIERAGGTVNPVIIRNLTPQLLQESLAALEKELSSAQMLVLPGGFSGGDEPDGSAKFIASLFRNPRLADSVHALLEQNDGLILGICNGFQALVKLGLLPYGRITPPDENAPSLTFNTIGRHQSVYVYTRVSSVLSPWLLKLEAGEVYAQSVSHGEGRFTASEQTLETLLKSGQIAFQYSNADGEPRMEIPHNPNGSAWAIEGITSPCGRVLGKMAHTERSGEYLANNIYGRKYMPLFEGGVGYFS